MKKRRWSLILTVVVILSTMMVTPVFAEEAAAEVDSRFTIPQPGERLKDKDNWACGETIIDTFEGVEIIIHDSVEDLATIERYEVIISGNTLEFQGKAALTYENGHQIFPIHEVFTDGERLVFYPDHSQGVMAELYVPFRQVAGTEDTIMYSLAILKDDKRVGSLSAAPLFTAESSKSSPYRLTRQAPKGAKSVQDILIPDPEALRLPLSTVPIEQPEQKPALDKPHSAAETTKPAGPLK